jgi:hypothetical protein
MQETCDPLELQIEFDDMMTSCMTSHYTRNKIKNFNGIEEA